MKHKGTITHIGETETFGDKGFKKRIVVITDRTQKYPQPICFEFHKDKCDILNDFNLYDEVEIEFYLNGKEYNGRYYNTLSASQLHIIEPNPNDKGDFVF